MKYFKLNFVPSVDDGRCLLVVEKFFRLRQKDCRKSTTNIFDVLLKYFKFNFVPSVADGRCLLVVEKYC